MHSSKILQPRCKGEFNVQLKSVAARMQWRVCYAIITYWRSNHTWAFGIQHCMQNISSLGMTSSLINLRCCILHWNATPRLVFQQQIHERHLKKQNDGRRNSNWNGPLRKKIKNALAPMLACEHVVKRSRNVHSFWHELSMRQKKKSGCVLPLHA